MLRKPNILVVGSFMMDLIASTHRVPNSGETVVGIKFQTAPGGKGANQAVQCARLGAKVTMVGRVGDDSFGKIMKETAQASGVDISHVSVDPKEASGVGHILLEITEHGSQNRITVCPGANYALNVEDLLWIRSEISRYDMVMMQLELPMDVIESVADWSCGAGVPVMLNPAPAAPLSEHLLSCITYLSPNEHEASLLAGRRLRTEPELNRSDVQDICQVLLGKGIKNLIITLGKHGAVAADRENILYTDCIRMPEVRDPTAAGDSFVAAFCTGICAGLSSKEALTFASYTAAITVSRMGAMPSLPTVSEVQALMQERSCSVLNPNKLNDLK